MPVILLLLLFCSACSTLPLKSEQVKILPDKTLQANGFAIIKNTDGQSFTQQWVTAKQEARLHAFRELATQMYKEVLPGGSTVGGNVIKDESYRIYVDMFLRNARSVDYQSVRDRAKVTLSLTLNQEFYRCMDGDLSTVAQCIQGMHKSTLTRLGSKEARVETRNLSCQSSDCIDQFYVAGFSKEPSAVDDALLDAGLYDSEWMMNTGGSLLGRYLWSKIVLGF